MYGSQIKNMRIVEKLIFRTCCSWQMKIPLLIVHIVSAKGRACLQAISWRKTVSRAKILANSASRRVARKSHIPSRNFSFFGIQHFTSVKPWIPRISFQTLGKPAP